MRNLAEQTHYEVLEVNRSAGSQEIERAYRMLQSTYATDSLALYSVFDEAEAVVLRERIDFAYRVLADADARKTYDEEVERGGSERETRDSVSLEEAPVSETFSETVHETVHETATRVIEHRGIEPTGGELAPGIEGFQDLEGDAEEGEEFDGPRLRRARLRRGIEIDQIASVTKVSPAFLRAIEEEKYDELPSPVYVRGFVIAFARAIGLDANGVATSYMTRMEESKPGRPRGRLLGRR